MAPIIAEADGVLQPDGTLVLDRKLELPPGPVKVVVRAVASPSQEGWWPYMQRVRAEREAAGYPFLDEKEMNAWIEQLREDDDRIERAYRGIEASGGQGKTP